MGRHSSGEARADRERERKSGRGGEAQSLEHAQISSKQEGDDPIYEHATMVTVLSLIMSLILNWNFCTHNT